MTDESRRFDRRTFVRGTGALVVAGSMAGCGDTGGGGGGNTVEMTSDLTFEPSDLSVATGETVLWENVGGGDHSVTASEGDIPDGATYFASGGFDSESGARDGWPEGAISEGETYEHTFETAGTYQYFCIPHEAAGMKGTITVE